MFEGDIEFDLAPFAGSNPYVFLVGQDPTIAKGAVYSVLDLNNKKSVLYAYLVKEILDATGIDLDHVYATDLIKCRFPHNQTPRRISEAHRIPMREFLLPFFSHCRKWFHEELIEVRPRIISSLGEPVHQLLIQEFQWRDVPVRMRDVFSNVFKVDLVGDQAYYVPCIHINSRGHAHYKGLWGRFIEDLSKTHRAVRTLYAP